MFLTYGGIFLSAGMEKGIKYNQDQSSIMLLLEHNFRHNAVVLRVTLKSFMLKFSSIMYLTLAANADRKRACSGDKIVTEELVYIRVTFRAVKIVDCYVGSSFELIMFVFLFRMIVIRC